MIAGFCLGAKPSFYAPIRSKKVRISVRHFIVNPYAPNWIYIIEYQPVQLLNILIAIDCKLNFVSLLTLLL
jgi:hypothetical protein